MPDSRPPSAANDSLPPTFPTHKMASPPGVVSAAGAVTASKVNPLERPVTHVLSCPNLVMSVLPNRSTSIDYSTLTADDKGSSGATTPTAAENNNHGIDVTPVVSSLRHLARFHHKHHMHLPPPPHSVKEPCRIGILLYNTHLFDRASRVMDHSISFCKFAALTILQAPTNDHVDIDNNEHKTIQNCREWLRETEEKSEGYGHHADSVPLYVGEDGLIQMLADPTLDAVYVIVPTEYHRQYAMQCLRAQKHVLIKDFRSTPLTEFVEQMDAARAHQRFLQFSTMFDIQYNVHSFLETVNQGKRFGRIDHIKADLALGDSDLEQVGAHRPLQSSDSCIHRLARYCVLMALLMTPSEQSKPLKAQIQDCSRNKDNVMVGASGKVWFDNGRLLEFKVGYSAVRTRQLCEVRSPTKYAVVTDFALAGTHGMHSFRVYDCQVSQDPVTGKATYDNVSAGEALDVPSGLPQHVMMWRGFAELCQLVQESGWNQATDATFLTSTALSLKATLLALDESAAQNNTQVPVVLLE